MKAYKILISRTDSIGDVILTLPLFVWLKERFPTCEIYFLGRNYTREIIESFSKIDHFIAWDDLEQLSEKEQVTFLKDLKLDYFVHVFPRKAIAKLAKKAKIPHRIGTSHRMFHLLTCNERVSFTRKNSPLHESQLNFELLRPFGLKEIPSLKQINEATHYFKAKATLNSSIQALLDTPLKKIILHPKSQGSAVEWGVENFVALSLLLVEKGCRVYFSGTENEGKLFREKIPKYENIIDITGKMSLGEFISFIEKSDALVAASTGPLHIAGLLNKQAIGLFSPRKPIHPGRWQPLGNSSETIVFDENCSNCSEGKSCDCIAKIAPSNVAKKLTD